MTFSQNCTMESHLLWNWHRYIQIGTCYVQQGNRNGWFLCLDSRRYWVSSPAPHPPPSHSFFLFKQRFDSMRYSGLSHTLDLPTSGQYVFRTTARSTAGDGIPSAPSVPVMLAGTMFFLYPLPLFILIILFYFYLIIFFFK